MANHGYFLEDLEVGMEAFHEKTVEEADVIAFADLTGDRNPVHLDESYAKKTMFRSRIAHGMLTASLLSTVLGMKLPGPGAIYISQSIRFRAPVRSGDKVRASARVTSVDRERRRATLACACSVGSEIGLDGEAVVMVPARDASG
jgi:3-hydroxybutyryl-CoA dehydratase